MIKSTTNFITVFLTVSSVCLVLFSMLLQARGISVEIDPVLAGFVSSFIWFVIWAKMKKEKKIEEVQKNLDSDDKDTQIDQLLNLTK